MMKPPMNQKNSNFPQKGEMPKGGEMPNRPDKNPFEEDTTKDEVN